MKKTPDFTAFTTGLEGVSFDLEKLQAILDEVLEEFEANFEPGSVAAMCLVQKAPSIGLLLSVAHDYLRHAYAENERLVDEAIKHQRQEGGAA